MRTVRELQSETWLLSQTGKVGEASQEWLRVRFGTDGKTKPPGRQLRRPGAPHIGYLEPGDSSRRSSSRRRRLTDASLGRADESSSFHPQAAWPGRKVHRCECCGSDRVADRPSALHVEAPHRRGWSTRLAPTIRAGELA